MTRILVATANPAAFPWSGNPLTAERWAAILRSLGHRADVAPAYQGEDAEILVALHARRSGPSVERFAAERPGSPIVVALTGTDLYVDRPEDPAVRRSLELATRVVVLQRHALEELPPELRAKAVVVYQSAEPCLDPPPRPAGEFRVAVVGHLRPVKDPFRAAEAARLLPEGSKARVLHVGKALSPEARDRALEEAATNPRYRWVGELGYADTRRAIASSHLVAITSWSEGSSNVLSEALADGVPVVSSRIGGIAGTLGEDYPGYFRAGDSAGLRDLLHQAEADPAFLEELARRGRAVAGFVRPERERETWRAILADLVVSAGRAE